MSEIKWQRVNAEPFEYAIQQGPHGDEFVKLLDGSCLRRDFDEIERLQRDIAVKARLLTNQNKENKRLRAALKPFAEAAEDAAGYPDDHPLGCDPAMHLALKIEDGAFAPLKVSHLRAAKIASEQKERET